MNHPYLPHTQDERRRMLSFLGLASEEDLLAPLPQDLRLKTPPDIPPPLSEPELTRVFGGWAAMNTGAAHATCFLGAGAYQHHIPAIVNHLSSRAEFYTAYTPYQPEMSQGLLQAIFEFQTMIAELCGLPVANASLYDGATAVAEAALMALAATRRRKVVAARSVHPDYRAVLRTYLRHRDAVLVEPELGDGFLRPQALELDGDTAAMIAAYPNFFGLIEDLAPLAAAAHEAGAMLVVAANPAALGYLEAPGALGADLVAGEGQPLGLPLSFGGPGLGFLAAREEHLRRIPGRLVGQTRDVSGRRGFVLTLQTREQHIRRERATSNICSNSALGALRAAIHLAAAGPGGLRRIGEQCAAGAHYAMERLTAGGSFKPLFDGPFFHEFALASPVPVPLLNRRLRERGIIGGLDLSTHYPELGQAILLAVTEARTAEEIDFLAEVMEASSCPAISR